MKKNEYVTSYGLFTTLVVTTIGIGIFSYPRELAEFVGNDGWFVILLSALICYVMLRVIWKIVKSSGSAEFSTMVKGRLGFVLGNTVLLAFAVYNLIGISLGMRAFSEVTKMYLLEKTPTEFLIVVTILAGTYLIRGGLSSVVKFNEVAFWVMFLPVIFVLPLALKDADFTNLLPVFRNEPVNYIKALNPSAFSFGGLSIAFLVAPYLKDKDEGHKALGRSIIFVAAFYLIIFTFVIATLTKYQVKELLWPTITMVKAINIQGAFLERWEGVIMALWIIFYFTTFTNGYYFASIIAKEMFSLGDVKIASLLIVPVLYILAMTPDSVAEVYDMGSWLMPAFTLFVFIVIPILLLIVGRDRSNNKKGAA